MKKARDEVTINTIPQGCYECGTSDDELRRERNTHPNNLTVDLQGNGYPMESSGSRETDADL